MRGGAIPALVRCLRRAGAAGPEVPDALLLERFVRQRDEAAFELLVWRHQRSVFTVCLRVLGDEHDAEDAFQATFLTLARKAGTIARRTSLGPWLRRVAYRIALRAFRNDVRRSGEEERAGRLRTAAVDEPATDATRHELQRVVHEEMDRLTEKYRVPLRLCYLEGQTNEQAARQLGCPEGTIATRLARGRKLLHSRLARRGLGLAGGLVPVALADSARAAPELIHTTVRAALTWAGGAVPPDLISPRVAGLTEEALRSMSLTKIKLAATCAALLGLLIAGGGVVAALTPADPPLAKPTKKPDADKPPEAAKDAKPEKPEKRDQQHKVTEKVTKSFNTGRSPRVVLDTFNGGVTIKTEAKDAVSVELMKEARGESDDEARESMKAIDISLSQEGNEIRVTAKRTDDEKDKDKHRQIGVSAELVVPVGAVLELRTNNGGMKLTGGTGPVTLTTRNGGIDVRDARGPLHLTTANGAIRVIGGFGKTELTTRNGLIEIEREKAIVTANTSNGAVTFKGSLAPGRHTFKTNNGSVQLTLPADTQFRIDASTSLGAASSDFTPAESKRRPSSQLKATVGDDPKVSITAHTSNGSISVRKAEK